MNQLSLASDSSRFLARLAALNGLGRPSYWVMKLPLRRNGVERGGRLVAISMACEMVRLTWGGVSRQSDLDTSAEFNPSTFTGEPDRMSNAFTKFRYVSVCVAIVAMYGMQIASAAEEPFVEKVDLFVAGTDGYELFRIPGIVVTANGTVLAYCEARVTGRGDWGPIDVLLRRSVDGGRTWSPVETLVHIEGDLPVNPLAAAQNLDQPGDNTVNNPVAIVDHESGAVHFLYCLEYMRCFYMRSDNDGLTWSEPIEITATFDEFQSDYAWKVLATGPGHAIQLTHGPHRGRLVVPIWLSLGTGGHAHRPSVTSTIYSDDHGETWQRGEIALPDTEEFVFPNETCVVQLADGSVMLNSRTESHAHRRLVTVSPDGATNWSEPLFDDALLEPICMASIIRVSDETTGERNCIAFSNPHNLSRRDGNETPGRGRDRINVSIKLSYDEGQTWPAQRLLEEGFSGYSDLAVLDNGTILCFYERGSVDDANHYQVARLSVARFNTAWVEAGEE